MTMTIEEKRRELFEAWASDNGKWPKAVERTADNQYLLMQTHSYWLAWNAALDAVVIELPKLWISNESCASEQAACQTLNACKQAIESTGLGLKVKS